MSDNQEQPKTEESNVEETNVEETNVEEVEPIKDPIEIYLALQDLCANPRVLPSLGPIDPAKHIEDYESEAEEYEDEDEEEAEAVKEEKGDSPRSKHVRRFKDPPATITTLIRRAMDELVAETPYAVGGSMELTVHDTACLHLSVSSVNNSEEPKLVTPFLNVDLDALVALCTPSGFGKVATAENLVDPEVRNGLEISCTPSESAVHVAFALKYPELGPVPDVNDYEAFTEFTLRWLATSNIETIQLPKQMSAENLERIHADRNISSRTFLPNKAKDNFIRTYGTQNETRKDRLQGPDLLRRILYHVKERLTPNTYVTFEPYKLMVYETGGHFVRHKDSPSENMIGTLLISVPSEHTGGVLEVFDGKSGTQFDFSDHTKVHWCAFFADCDHVLHPVTSGRRVVLAFHILVGKGGLKSMEDYYPAKDTMSLTPPKVSVVERALRGVARVSKFTRPVGILLRHQYGLLSLTPEGLKGMDKLVYDHVAGLCKKAPRLYNILVSERGDTNDNGNYEARSERSGGVYAISMELLEHHANGAAAPPPPPDDDVFFIRGDWVCSDVSLKDEDERALEFVGNESQAGSYAYVYLQCAMVVDPEDFL